MSIRERISKLFEVVIPIKSGTYSEPINSSLGTEEGEISKTIPDGQERFYLRLEKTAKKRGLVQEDNNEL